MKKFITSISLAWLLCILAHHPAFSQKLQKENHRSVILKTNLLNVLAKGPSVSLEKFINKSYSLELTYMQGEFNNYLLTDHYDYRGFLIRGKKYFSTLKSGDISPYGGVYTGLLKRNLFTKGDTDNSGFFSYPSRDFSANSIRSGVTVGGLWLWKNNFVADMQGSLGYGRYLRTNKSDGTGYLDIQIWLSVGYYF